MGKKKKNDFQTGCMKESPWSSFRVPVLTRVCVYQKHVLWSMILEKNSSNMNINLLKFKDQMNGSPPPHKEYIMNITKHHFYMEMFSLILSESFSLSFFFWLHWVFVAVCGLLIAVASLVAEHGLSSGDSQAQ